MTDYNYTLFNTDTDNSKVNGVGIGQKKLEKNEYTFHQAYDEAQRIGALLIVSTGTGSLWYLKGGNLDKNHLNYDDLYKFLMTQQYERKYRPKSKTYLIRY